MRGAHTKGRPRVPGLWCRHGAPRVRTAAAKRGLSGVSVAPTSRLGRAAGAGSGALRSRSPSTATTPPRGTEQRPHAARAARGCTWRLAARG